MEFDGPYHETHYRFDRFVEKETFAGAIFQALKPWPTDRPVRCEGVYVRQRLSHGDMEGERV
jgi:hypothetical protein